MQNQDLIVLKRLKEWRDAKQRAVLVTVMRTWGSSPRPIGSIMAMCENGAVVGSVSGGCIEDDLIREFTQPVDTEGSDQGKPGMTMEGVPKRMRYGITADEAHRFGLPCGGTLELLLEFNPEAQPLTDLIDRLERGDLMRRVTDMSTGEVTLEATETADSLRITDSKLINTFGPSYRMLLIGAGQLGEYIATMAIFNGFTVTVCDPREEYASGWTTTGVNRMSDWPDDAVKRFKPDRRTCVLALTHDPKLDDLALLETLETEAFYVGAIGSRSNNAARRKRMMEHFEQTEESLARLRGPIGIYIGSKTPAEIAVSVMAEVLAVKNGVPPPRDMDVGHAKSAQEKHNS